MKPEVDGLRLPEFPALEWHGSAPLRAADLRGRAPRMEERRGRDGGEEPKLE